MPHDVKDGCKARRLPLGTDFTSDPYEWNYKKRATLPTLRECYASDGARTIDNAIYQDSSMVRNNREICICMLGLYIKMKF